MRIFVSANNTDKGKTYTVLKLMEGFAKKGFRVGAIKPIETGVGSIPKDGFLLYEKAKRLNPDFSSIGIDDVVPIQHSLPAAPIVSGEVDFKKIKNAFNKISNVSDVVLIEGAGGILVPVKNEFKMIDFVDFFSARLFLVIGSNLGMINDFLLNKYYLENNGYDYMWAINLFDEDYFTVSYPYMKRFSPLYIQKDLDKIIEKLIGE